jgi:hypothetical protein
LVAPGSWKDLVWITYPPKARLLEGDIVRLVGLGYGNHYYTSIFGVEKTMPEITVLSIRTVG